MIALLFDLGLAITLFASTNLDDLFVLIGFFSDPRYRPRQIVVGQVLGLSALVLASLAGALLSLVVRPAWLGLMGLVPIALGVRHLLALRDDAENDAKAEPPAGAASAGNALAVAGVTIANGGDNIGIYTPVFATASGPRLLLFVAVFAAMVALWLGLAHWLVHHPVLGAPIRRIGRVATPFVLIGIGVMVLVEGGRCRGLRSGRHADEVRGGPVAALREAEPPVRTPPRPARPRAGARSGHDPEMSRGLSQEAFHQYGADTEAPMRGEHVDVPQAADTLFGRIRIAVEAAETDEAVVLPGAQGDLARAVEPVRA